LKTIILRRAAIRLSTGQKMHRVVVDGNSELAIEPAVLRFLFNALTK
jgi:hypothetical protein